MKRLKEQEYLEKLNEDESYIEYFSKFALQTFRIEPEYTKEIMKEVLTISRLKDYKIAQAESLLYLGWCYHDEGKYKIAIDRQIEALNIFIQKKNKKAMSRVYNALLPNYMYIGMFELAIESGLRGIEIAEQLKEEETLIALFINTSLAYIQCEKYNEAYEMAIRIKNSSVELKKENEITLNCIMSEVEINLGYLDSAYKHYKIANNLSKSENAVMYYAEIASLRARIHCKKEMYDECKKDFDKALEYAEKFNGTPISAHVLFEYAAYFYTIQDYNNAKEKVIQAIELSKSLNLMEVMGKAYKLLSVICEKMEQYKEALEAFKAYEGYEKQLYNLSSSISFAQLGNKALEIKANMYETLYKKLEIISQIGQRLTTNLNIEQIFDSIYQELQHIIEADNFGIGLYKKDKQVLSYEFFIESGERYDLGEVSIDREDSLGSYCLKNKEIVVINNLDEDYKKYVKVSRPILKKQGKRPYSLIYYPLTIDNKDVGVLTIQSYKKNAYNREDLNTLKIFATYAAIAIWNAILFKKVHYLASYDGLTEVLNRREILKMGELYYKAARKSKEQLCIIMFDIDHFKGINDQYGHVIGDEILKKISETASKSIAGKGFIGRYGGEEFIILLPDIALEEAYKIPEYIRRKIMEQKHLIMDNPDLCITVSLGIYLCNGEEASFYEGINLADKALYEAKRQGRNCVVCYNEKKDVPK